MAVIVQPDDLRAALSSRVRELVGCETVIHCSRRDEERAIVADFSTSPPLPALRLDLHGTLCKWLFVNQEPLLVPHPTGAFQYLDATERSRLTELQVRACVPLLAGDRLLGILLLADSRQDWQFGDERDLLDRLGRQAGLALENAELHYQERERLRTRHQSEQLAVAGLLAATVAHEVRNPLTAIRSTIQYVLDSGASWESKQPMLDEVLGAVDRIEHIVGGILALNRPNDPGTESVDLLQICEQSLLLIQAYAAANGIAVERRYEHDELVVRGNGRELSQVCTNLILNACQAMDAGGRLTVVGAIMARTPGVPVMAMIQIRDTGCGMSKEQLEHAFDPFYTTKKSGTGLGLSICLEIVTRHDGRLGIQSEVGHGAVATCLIPLLTIA